MESHPALPSGLHVAIIMDGNGRWAEERGFPRTSGHRAGAAAVRRVVEAAPALGIGTLTLYAFSSDNWSRPSGEIARLMGLLREYLQTQVASCVTNGVRVTVIGRRDRLPGALVTAVQAAEAATGQCRRLHLRLAVDYSARQAILEAARQAREGPLDLESFARRVAGARQEHDAVAVDLLIRTGGERRLSDFLLWECAYAELVFVDRRWPDFTAADLARAVDEFRSRERRFGSVPGRASGAR